MGYGLRWFVAEDDGTVTRVPAATCERWFDGEALPAARAGRFEALPPRGGSGGLFRRHADGPSGGIAVGNSRAAV